MLSNDISMDSEGGYTASIAFEGYVEQYVPQTRKLVFEDSDVGWAEFRSMLDDADAVEIIRDYEEC